MIYTQPVYAASGERPNIVLIMADDMGYGDPGCFNPESKAPTPRIDELAKGGMRFTDAHSPAAVCVQTRYGLMTGRYPFRARLNWRREGVIEKGRMTVASLLADNGYHTGCIGKWHLGFDGGPDLDYGKPLSGGPVNRGFASYFGIPASLDIPPYYYIRGDRAVAAPTERAKANSSPGWSPIQGAFWRAGGVAPGFRFEDVLPKLGEEAAAYIAARAKEGKKDRPFFLYVALTSPHTPWLPTRRFAGKSRAGMYGDFVASTDAVVGRVLNELTHQQLADDTLVIFTSDNGPVWYNHDEKRFGHRSTLHFRGMKGDAWEGGHRMPFVARWPGRVSPGATSDQTICHTDLLATCAALVDAKLPADAGEDSFDFLPALLGKAGDGARREALVSQSSGGYLAIRQGPWKLIPGLGSGGFSKPRRGKPLPDGPRGQLYHLDKDPSETTNLWKSEPARVEALTKLLEKFKRDGRSRP